MTRVATLEDVTRRCSVGLGERASLLEEGITLARQARAQLGEAEVLFANGLNALSSARAAFAGTSEYMLTSTRLLGELADQLEGDVQELRGAQSALAQIEEPIADAFQKLVRYSIEAIQSRMRSRMQKLGGDFSVPPSARSLLPSLAPSAGPVARRRSESVPPKELVWSEIEDDAAIDAIVQAGLDNFERSAALLEGCFDALQGTQLPLANANKALEALVRKFRTLAERESGSSASEVTGVVAELVRLAAELEQQMARLGRLSSEAERARAPLLAIIENMGRLLVSSVVAETSLAEVHDVSAKEVLARALKGETEALREFSSNADTEQLQAMSDALFHVARTQDEGAGLPAVQSLRELALSSVGSRTLAADNLLSLSNSPTAPEAVRAAANAALVDLTDGSGSSG